MTRLDGPDMDAEFVRLPDLASRRLGGAVVDASDDFFADRAALVMPGPVKPRTEFGYRGKFYDGWETRRRRVPGSDHATVRLGIPGIVHGVVVDTSFFRGNYPPEISVQATALEDYPGPAELAAAEWTTLVARSPAKGDTANVYEVDDRHRFTHVRLTIHPDARSMSEGWETARRRGGGNDWVVVALPATSRLRDIVVDTSHFLGNAPGEVQISGATIERAGTDPASLARRLWAPLVARRPVRPDTPHRFRICPGAPTVTHLRVDIYPDGGFARLRAHGELTPAAHQAAVRRWLDALPPAHLRQALSGAGLDRALVAGALSVQHRRVGWSSELLAAFAPP